MRIVDPQSAVLTNVEVLAYLNSNPPRRSPNPPPNSGQHWVPSPDLRDHNTVIKEIHNYVSRISPHILRYPRHSPRPSSSQSRNAMTGTFNSAYNSTETQSHLPPAVNTEVTPMDHAIRDLIKRLQPYRLTKAEVVMILNLGVGVSTAGTGESETVEEENLANGESIMEVDQPNGHVNGEAEENGEGEEEDQGALALFESVVEERESRLTDEQVSEILAIIREVLTGSYEV